MVQDHRRPLLHMLFSELRDGLLGPPHLRQAKLTGRSKVDYKKQLMHCYRQNEHLIPDIARRLVRETKGQVQGFQIVLDTDPSQSVHTEILVEPK